MELRQYQRNAVDATYNYFRGNPSGHPVMVAPTASGKSHIIAHTIGENLDSGARFLMATHRKELIQQNAEKLVSLNSSIDLGIYSAGLNQRSLTNQVVYAGIQSIWNKAGDLGPIDLMMIDEAHLCPVKTQTGMYRSLIDSLLRINPKMNVMGYTATAYRLDNGLLTDGDQALFTDLIEPEGMSIPQLIKDGYLCPLVTPDESNTVINTSKVGKVASEFNLGQLEAVSMEGDTTEKICRRTMEQGTGRKCWLFFAVTVRHAEQIRDSFAALGISCAVISGETSKAERDRLIADHRAGIITCLVNVNVLTTGYDNPRIDLLGFARGTQSTSLYVQMAGRGMRTDAGKQDCLVLDFAGLISTHGPVDIACQPPKFEPEERKEKQPKEEALKECPACLALVHIGVQQCKCGYMFSSVGTKPSTDAILSDGGKVVVSPTKVAYKMQPSKHDGYGRMKPPVLLVNYFFKNKIVAKEYVCLYHHGFAGDQAFTWWELTVNGKDNIPSDTREVVPMLEELGWVPREIHIRKRGNFYDIHRIF